MKTILDCSPIEASKFFMSPSRYCTLELPEYYDFSGSLDRASKFLIKWDFCSYKGMMEKAQTLDDINCRVLLNKDGKFQWRELQIIHPLFYVALVKEITTEDSWELLMNRFRELDTPNIQCVSMPLYHFNKTKKSDVLNWWKRTEQKSIEYALDYQWCATTDITDCYSSIYTHSIAWAIHDEDIAKAKIKDWKFLGTRIDFLLQAMSYGQTNGIPQGSALMDFLAEILLRYADNLLYKALLSDGIKEYQICRYRDDYKIFARSSNIVETILKDLTMVLSSLGLKINSKKTQISSNVIEMSIKEDKRYYIANPISSGLTIQKQLLRIWEIGNEYPNSGSLQSALSDFNESFQKTTKKPKDAMVLISIVADIMLRNPKSLGICSSILSRLLAFFSNDEALLAASRIKEKFESAVSSDYLNIWLQRIIYPYQADFSFKGALCCKVKDKKLCLWNSSWLSKGFSERDVINTKAIHSMKKIIPPKYVGMFEY